MREAKAFDQETIEILPPDEPSFKDIEYLAALLDNIITIPGTRVRVGLDSVIGLLPGLGDALGTLLSSYLVYRGAQAGLPLRVLLRMIGNIAVDSAVGIVPIAGDLFDIAYKSNLRNLRILQKELASPARRIPRSPNQADRLIVRLSLSLVVLVLILLCLAIAALISVAATLLG